MKSPDGGYYTAIDADSEGEEGKFYLWTEDELKDILKEDFDEFKNLFDIESNGNFFNEREQSDTGLNIIYPKFNSFMTHKNENGLEWMNEKALSSLKILLQERAKRVRPETDTKVIASTNGMILSALSIAYLATFDNKYKEASTELFEFIKKKFLKGDYILRIEYNNGKEIRGQLEDYANVINGILQFYRVTMDEDVLQLFTDSMKFSLATFRMKDGIFIYKSEYIIKSKKEELYDTAIPNPNSIFLRNTAFYSLIFNDYEFAMSSLEINLDVVNQLFAYAESYLWYIASLFEILRFIVIKATPKNKKRLIKEKLNYLTKAEKIINFSTDASIQICNVHECYYNDLNIEKLDEISNII
jgi:uncharacterized protein YyaL (SSP411 family)